MDSMETRRNAIVELINEKGTVSFSQLKDAFPNVSEMTLRTDLKLLDEAKRILRIHGGARSVQVIIGTDDFLNRKSVRNIPEKQKIAEKALTLLHPDTTIFLDSGSTTTMFARQFPDQSNLIYTTGLSCATELANLSKPIVMLPGGRLNRYSQSIFGFSAIKELERINFHQVFLGITGFHYSAGFTGGINEEVILKQTAIRQSEQVIALMDSSKIGVKCSFGVCGLADIDIVVSDGKLPEEFLAECRKYGVTVL
ncbi:DeoR/GlpR family DNA-binding transcription regulator [Lacrimispora sp. 210928-DFI.3.58]|uniref:DeoR/GlpR family DNA-binding transcription regulator n=1 Tax=Lacrimispora sp. 210928-DFI.3.58 TaxID=2883214 RepID=UPI001D06195A|nr:DeoR/GlpR family DNA-binding transcription regulator [Lacrimispora sp. 210928-DFI.3.58]MCB7320383.1 DeoR/GlpR family DNA-binding transcription regulator [Lacrimispora sp. 210928-DFI.3.58]